METLFISGIVGPLIFEEQPECYNNLCIVTITRDVYFTTHNLRRFSIQVFIVDDPCSCWITPVLNFLKIFEALMKQTQLKILHINVTHDMKPTMFFQ